MNHRVMPARMLQNRRRLLKRTAYLLDRRFIRRPNRYFAQAALATIVLAIIITIEDALTNAAVVTAIAATAFLVFMAPNAKLAQPRRVIGGHAVAIVIGLMGAGVVHGLLDEPYTASLPTDVAAAIAVGVSMLVMAATDTEHPPAAGTVLGLVLAPHAVSSGALVIVAAIALSAARNAFRRWLIDLTG